jgi:arylsulfatase A-like enzyme/Flp pilus assembly protein TadD
VSDPKGVHPAPARPHLAPVLSVLLLVAVASLLGALAWRLTPPEGPPMKRPRRTQARQAVPDEANLLLITIDGVRADRLGSYGDAPLSPTPYLDRLAAEGFLFEQALSPAPQTFPAHAAILTGFSPAGRDDLFRPGAVLPPEHATLAEILRSSGYKTAAFVGATALGRASGLARGFDRYDEPRPGPLPSTLRWLAERPSSEVIDAARAWLDEHFRGRFFLWVHLSDPAAPIPPEALRAAHRRTPYDADLQEADAGVGRLLQRLASLGVAGHTLVAVAGSHGVGLGDHGEQGSGLFLYDTTLRVPMILRLPGVAVRERSIPEQVRLVDLAPTLLDLLRLAPPEAMEGTSLAPLLDPEGTLPPLAATAEAHAPRLYLASEVRRAVRADGFKLIAGATEELYDLRRDPGETRNLSVVQADRAASLRRFLPAARAGTLGPTGTIPAGAPPRGGAVPAADPLSSTPALLEEGFEALRTGEAPRARRALEDLRQLLVTGRRPVPPALLALLGGALRLQGRLDEALQTDEEALRGIDREEVAAADTAQATAAAAGGAAPASPVSGGAATAQAAASAAQPVSAPVAGPTAVAPASSQARPDTLRALLKSEIGACRRLRGETDAAIAAYREAVAVRPDDSEDRLALADLLAGAGRPEDAIDELRKALARAPGEALLLAGLGRALLAAGQPEAAEKELIEALRDAPWLTSPWFDLGRTYEALQRPADAVRAYQDLMARTEPNDPLHRQASDRERLLRTAPR